MGAVRAMAILGMLTGSGALITLGLYTFLRLETWSRILKFSAIGSCLGAGKYPELLSVIKINCYSYTLPLFKQAQNARIT